MAKTFAPRVSKKSRKTIDLSDRLSRDLFKASDEKLLQGAKLDEIELADVVVKEQVRTKFNDSSIKELANNIESNGLIQPLVLHKKGRKYILICGERRFRAMSLIKMKSAPCFVLEDKSEKELMAIQFSENSSREELHYIDKADGIYNYKVATKVSERKIQAALGISKSEVHRSILIGKMSSKIKEAAKVYNIEKYVLLEFDALASSSLKKKIEKQILSGEVTKRAQFRKIIKNGEVLQAVKKKVTKKVTKKTMKKTVSRSVTANAFIKAMESRTKDLKLDSKTKKLLESLVQETSEIVDL